MYNKTYLKNMSSSETQFVKLSCRKNSWQEDSRLSRIDTDGRETRFILTRTPFRVMLDKFSGRRLIILKADLPHPY